jgi:hypothetical protein
MKKRILILFLLAFIIGFSSCTKEINKCALSQVYLGGNLYLNYSFYENKLSKVDFFDSNDGNLYFSWEIYWNEQNQIDHVDYFNYLNGVAMERAVITRNADGNVHRVYYWNDANNDMIPETMTSFKEYIYNTDKKVQEEKLYTAPNFYTSSVYYTWSDNNLVRKDDNLGHVLYTYDNQKSMYEGCKELFFVFSEPNYLLSNPTFLSANNALTISSFDIGDNLLSTTTYNFTYNADGYPVSADSPYQFSYEYNCAPE